MRFHFRKLVLICRASQELLEFAPNVSFFHGQISSGKSSVARLIDFCLGGDIEMTTALQQELVSAQLEALIGQYEVILERAKSSNQVQVSWRTSSPDTTTVAAPIQASAGGAAIWGEAIYNLSDLLFYLSGLMPIKVRRSATEPESPLVRLSFRDVLWYCYLRQEQIDSSFFNLDKPILQVKSRDVMRTLVGFYTERLASLEAELERVTTERQAKEGAAEQLRTFLEEFGFGSEEQFLARIDTISKEKESVQTRLDDVRRAGFSAAHPVDSLRGELRQLTDRLSAEERALTDLQVKIGEQNSLRAELLSTKFKILRATTASSVLAGVEFERCPACGRELSPNAERDSKCRLCGRGLEPFSTDRFSEAESLRRDIINRIDELTDSIQRHDKARHHQQQLVENLRREKATRDRHLQEELRNYDSAFLSETRDLDRLVATLEERLNGLEKVKKMPESISKLEREADQLASKQEEVKREIGRERGGLHNADNYVSELEELFLETLTAVGVPGVREGDRVEINRRTWFAYVLPQGEEALRWSFSNAGSGGKKTLLNACYALAVHRLAAKHNLPLPSFLIVDTPMKNIGEDVNREIFVSFYREVYKLAAGELSETQLVLIDKEFVPPEQLDLHVLERFMTPDQDQSPPLISYYRGP